MSTSAGYTSSDLYLPTSALGFLTPPAEVVITSPSQKVLVVGGKTLAVNAPTVVSYNVCYQLKGLLSWQLTTILPNYDTQNYINLAAGAVLPISEQAVATGIPAGTYLFGLCGSCFNGQDNNFNLSWTHAGFTHAILMN